MWPTANIELIIHPSVAYIHIPIQGWGGISDLLPISSDHWVRGREHPGHIACSSPGLN